MRVETKDFSQAVDRVSTVSADRTRSVKMALEADRLRLTVNNPEAGSALEELSVDYGGEPIEIGFNARYLLDVAQQVDGETATFRLGRSVFADRDCRRRRRARTLRIDAAKGVVLSQTAIKKSDAAATSPAALSARCAKLRRLTLTDFRSYERAEIAFDGRPA